MVVNLTTTAASAPTGQGFTLLDARTEFVIASRRYDLVVDAVNYVNKGADRYINNGIRFLDQKVDHPKQFRREYFKTAVNDFFIRPEYLIHPRNIYVVDADSSVDITNNRLSLSGFKAEYDDPDGSQVPGTPCNWALNAEGLAPSQIGDTSATFTTAGFLAFDDVHFQADSAGPDWNFNTILLGPKADAVYTIIIDGKYFSRPLLDDSNQNFWTVQYPELVIQAALFMLERNMRNTAGMRSILEGLNEQLSDLDNVAVEWEFDGYSARIGEDNV